MALQNFAVMQCGLLWQVIAAPSEGAALAGAASMGRLARSHDHDAEVLIHRENELRRHGRFSA
jgi:hypothetical protein